MLYRQPEWRRGTIKEQQKFSLQANRKTREGDSHPDRDAHSSPPSTLQLAPLAEGQAVISVNTKKKAAIKSNALNFTANGTTRFAPPKIRHFIFRQRTYPASHIYSQ
jgi:hypothetical protein